MSINHVIIVCGAESCGNRLVRRLLIASGMIDLGLPGRESDVSFPDHGGENLVWIRTTPHAREWPDLIHMSEIIRQAGYAPAALVPVRDWFCATASQVNAGHVEDDEEAFRHLRQSTIVYQQLLAARVPFVPVIYEALVARPHMTMRNCLRLLDVGHVVSFDEQIVDGNARWLGR